MLDFSAISNRSVLGRALRSALRVVPGETRVPVLQGRLRGAWWIVGSATHGCWLGSYEREKHERFASSISPGHVVYDVGANVGFYTLLACRATGPHGRVFAFEPLPRNLGYLRKHLSLNRMTNATVVAAAVSDRSGETPFTEGDNPSTGRTSREGPLLVPAIALDAFVYGQENPPPQVIKMDIEGGELAALKGAERTLREARPLIFLATHGPNVHRACVDLLLESNYRIESLDTSSVDMGSELLASA
jgi:FkbM family methyltransferase